MPINTHDLSDLTSAQIAELYHGARRLDIERRYQIEEHERRRPRSASASRAHFLPGGGICECENPKAHYPEQEKSYIHPDGYVTQMAEGEEIPLTEEQRQIRFYESMADSQMEGLPLEDQTALREWREARAEQISAEFKDACPRYYPCPKNVFALVNHLAFEHLSTRVDDPDEVEDYIELLLQRGKWTVKDLSKAFSELYKAGRLESKPGVAKPLNADELRQLSALASGCRSDRDYEQVLEKYLELSGIELSWREAAIDSVYSPIVEKAVFWIWEQAQDTYTPTAERRAAIRKYLAGRFPTVKLLNAAWLAVQKAEEREEQGATPAPAPKLSPDEEKLRTAQGIADAIAQESFRGM